MLCVFTDDTWFLLMPCFNKLGLKKVCSDAFHRYTHLSMNINEQEEKKIVSAAIVALFVLLNNAGYADSRCPPIILS